VTLVANKGKTMAIELKRGWSNMTRDETAKTVSVPDAGKRYFGLAKNASYAAAARGQIPVIKIGGRLRVPVCQLERMLEGIKLTELAK
jgi:hypothetical protein